MAPLLEVAGLRVAFDGPAGPLEAVRGVDLVLEAGAVLGVVGESGSGKSVAMKAVMGLLPDEARVSGSVRFRGREIAGLDDRAMRALRGGEIAMIFQDPLSALNPVLTIGAQIVEMLRLHQHRMTRAAARRRALELLDLVSIAEPARRLDQYPHELSGGMRQRAMIAMAVANDPALLVADEPTTALDVTVQAQILDMMRALRRRLGIGLVLITHDLGVVAGMADHVAVMYAGAVVESAPVDALFDDPRHPYTRGLLAALPQREGGGALVSIEGTPPALGALPPGCAFAPRCPHAGPRCIEEAPAPGPSHGSLAACHFADDFEAFR